MAVPRGDQELPAVRAQKDDARDEHPAGTVLASCSCGAGVRGRRGRGARRGQSHGGAGSAARGIERPSWLAGWLCAAAGSVHSCPGSS
eukprot:359834-Chlamydomonas_euryale.AAC.9